MGGWVGRYETWFRGCNSIWSPINHERRWKYWSYRTSYHPSRDRWIEWFKELLQESEAKLTDFLSYTVAGDESWVYRYDPLSQQEAKIWKMPSEPTTTHFSRQKSAGKILIIFFWDQVGVSLTDNMPRKVAVSGPHYAPVIERLHFAILKKRRDKNSRGVLPLHNNAPIRKYRIVQADFLQILHPLITIYS